MIAHLIRGASSRRAAWKTATNKRQGKAMRKFLSPRRRRRSEEKGRRGWRLRGRYAGGTALAPAVCSGIDLDTKLGPGPGHLAVHSFLSSRRDLCYHGYQSAAARCVRDGMRWITQITNINRRGYGVEGLMMRFDCRGIICKLNLHVCVGKGEYNQLVAIYFVVSKSTRL